MSGRTIESLRITQCDKTAKYVPTLEEIEAGCERIRRGWNTNELHARTVVHSDAPVETVLLVTSRPNPRGRPLFHE